MGRKIRASSLFEARWLVVTRAGIKIPASGIIGGTRRYAFEEIDAVLLKDDRLLSVQMRDRTYTLEMKRRHRSTVDQLVTGCRASLRT